METIAKETSSYTSKDEQVEGKEEEEEHHQQQTDDDSGAGDAAGVQDFE